MWYTCVATLQLSSKTFVRDEYLTNKHVSLYKLSLNCAETDSVRVQALHLQEWEVNPLSHWIHSTNTNLFRGSCQCSKALLKLSFWNRQ